MIVFKLNLSYLYFINSLNYYITYLINLLPNILKINQESV
jgi:hypothetical protein